MRKRNFLIIIIVTCAVMLLSCDGNNTADRLFKVAADYYKNATSVEVVQNINMCIGYADPFTLKFGIINTNINANTAVFNEPFKFMSTSIANYKNAQSSNDISNMLPESMEMVQYGEKNGEDMIIYELVSGLWYKIPMKFDTYLSSDTQGINYIRNHDLYFEKGIIIGEENLNGVNTNKAEFLLTTNYAKELFKQYGYSSLIPKKDEAKKNQQIIDIMKDVKLEVWFNKADDSILKMYMNLTSIIPSVSKLTIEKNGEDMTEEEKKDIETAYKNAVIDNEIYFKSINECEEFLIPKEALDAPGI